MRSLRGTRRAFGTPRRTRPVRRRGRPPPAPSCEERWRRRGARAGGRAPRKRRRSRQWRGGGGPRRRRRRRRSSRSDYLDLGERRPVAVSGRNDGGAPDEDVPPRAVDGDTVGPPGDVGTGERLTRRSGALTDADVVPETV